MILKCLSSPDDLTFKNNSKVWVTMKLNLSPGHLHHPQCDNSAEAFISRMWRWGRFLCMAASQVLFTHFIQVSRSPLSLWGLCLAPPLLEGCWTLTNGEINHIVAVGLAKHNIEKDRNTMEKKSEKRAGSCDLWAINGRGREAKGHGGKEAVSNLF